MYVYVVSMYVGSQPDLTYAVLLIVLCCVLLR